MGIESCLDQRIKQVCPIIGISFGDLEDKSTWVIQYDLSTTADQQTAAQAVLAEFLWDDATQEIDRKQIRDAQYATDLSMVSAYNIYLQAHPGDTFSQYLDYLETLTI